MNSKNEDYYKEQILSNGAEAIIRVSSYLGREAVEKKRIPKKYRNPILDAKIREARTGQEAVLLHKAKLAGVESPVLYNIDAKEASLVMEKVEGGLVKKILNAGNCEDICSSIGAGIARLHKAGIIHGDLTTSNIILGGNNGGNSCCEIVFIDFGLGFFSKKDEDFAVDLLNLKKTYTATHFNIPQGWEKVRESYVKEFPEGKKVVEKISEIEERARYM